MCFTGALAADLYGPSRYLCNFTEAILCKRFLCTVLCIYCHLILVYVERHKGWWLVSQGTLLEGRSLLHDPYERSFIKLQAPSYVAIDLYVPSWPTSKSCFDSRMPCSCSDDCRTLLVLASNCSGHAGAHLCALPKEMGLRRFTSPPQLWRKFDLPASDEPLR